MRRPLITTFWGCSVYHSRRSNHPNSAIVVFKVFIILLSILSQDKGGGCGRPVTANIKYCYVL